MFIRLILLRLKEMNVKGNNNANTLLCNNQFATALFSAHAIFADMPEWILRKCYLNSTSHLTLKYPLESAR